MDKQYKYMVCTRCFTFNQALYIEDAMRGFTMQETSFPVVSVIVDDASTDGEPEMILYFLSEFFDKPYRKEETEYATIICARHKANANCEFVVLLLKYNHYSINKPKMPYLDEWLGNAKYHALCEGDDYWIHPLKLKRQVDFLESHPDYSLCFNNALVTYDFLDRPADIFNKMGLDGEVNVGQLLDKWICPTPGILIRSSILPLYPINETIISGDWHRTLHCAATGRVWYMKSLMSCYRKTDLPTSMSNTYSRRSDEAFLKKVPILEGFDEYTEGKYHDLVSKYINYYSKMGQLVAFKKKHGMLITCLLKPFTLIEMVWKRSIRPRIDKNAPTYSA